jgi:signal transduction histidine kinase
MPIRGLRAEAYRTGEVVFDNDFAESRWMELMPEGHVRLENVLFAPLSIEGATVGILGAANKPGPGFTREDARAALTLAEIASIALANTRTREQILRAREMLDAVGRMARVGGWEIEVPSRTLSWTDEVYRILELPPDTPVDFDRGLTFYHPDDRPLLLSALSRAMSEGTPFDLELRAFTAGGRSIAVNVQVRAEMRGASVTRLFGTFQDITERKRAEAERHELEEAMRQHQKLESLGVLAGGIAHDFNNLLMGVLGNASLALEDLPPSSPVIEYLQEIETAARRASELSQQMLDYSGRGRFVVERVDLDAVIDDMSEMLLSSVRPDAALRFHLARDLPPIEADVSQMRQVILNLVTNASEALCDGGGVIDVSTSTMRCDAALLQQAYPPERLPEGNYVVIEVADDGTGMDAETRERVFDPFFTTKFQGRGLGLAATLGIVRGHGGAIRVESEPSRGTTFQVLLPLPHGPAPAPAP